MTEELKNLKISQTCTCETKGQEPICSSCTNARQKSDEFHHIDRKRPIVCTQSFTPPATPKFKVLPPKFYTKERPQEDLDKPRSKGQVLGHELDWKALGDHSAKNVISKIWEHYLREKISSDDYEEDDDLPEEVKEAIRLYRKDLGKVSAWGNSNFVWLTVNPKQGTPWIGTQAIMERICKWSWIKEMTWCFEITKNKTRAPHVHALIIKRVKKAPSAVSAQIRGACSSIVGNPTSQNQINIKHISENDVSDKRDYLDGKKFKENKLPDVELTKEWRKFYKLPDVFSSADYDGEQDDDISESDSESE